MSVPPGLITYLRVQEGITIVDNEHCVMFHPKPEDYEHKSCCWCCKSNVFVKVLIHENNTYKIKQIALQDTPSMYLSDEDVNAGYGYCQGHDSLKESTEHPFPTYKQLIDNDPYHPYYIFLKKYLMDNDDTFRSKFNHANKQKKMDDYSEMYFIFKYLE